jgi:hypothetical protein
MIEVLKQALEALELHAKQYPHMQKGYTVDAITSLRQAIAEAEKQEPVAWGIANTRPTERNPLMMVMLDEPAPSHLVIPLYTHPQPKREPLTHEMAKQMKEQMRQHG